jgi:hypothetical protein
MRQECQGSRAESMRWTLINSRWIPSKPRTDSWAPRSSVAVSPRRSSRSRPTEAFPTDRGRTPLRTRIAERPHAARSCSVPPVGSMPTSATAFTCAPTWCAQPTGWPPLSYSAPPPSTPDSMSPNLGAAHRSEPEHWPVGRATCVRPSESRWPTTELICSIDAVRFVSGSTAPSPGQSGRGSGSARRPIDPGGCGCRDGRRCRRTGAVHEHRRPAPATESRGTKPPTWEKIGDRGR